MSIKIFTTGGTIDKIYFDAKSEFQIGDPGILDLLKDANVCIEYQIESLMRKDSLDMNDDDRQLIYDHVKKEGSTKILLTHGTDTMVKTAIRLLEIKDKTIVITGSMQPALLRDSDAAFNIGSAITALGLLAPGVYIAMHGCIFNPHKTRKNVILNRFEVIL